MKTLRVWVFEGEKQGHGDVTKNRRKVCGVVMARATSEPTVVGSIPTNCESSCSSVAEHWRCLVPIIPATKRTGVAKVRVTSTKESALGNRRDAASKSRLVSSSNNKREPIVPIGPAGMVRRRVTSSVKRRGTVVPLLCSIFLPARICRKATELDVVKDRITSPTTREDVGSSHLIHRSSQAIALETAGQ